MLHEDSTGSRVLPSRSRKVHLQGIFLLLKRVFLLGRRLLERDLYRAYFLLLPNDLVLAFTSLVDSLLLA